MAGRERSEQKTWSRGRGSRRGMNMGRRGQEQRKAEGDPYIGREEKGKSENTTAEWE